MTQRSRIYIGAAALAAAAIGGVVLAQQGVIATQDTVIEIRETPQANVITVTDVDRRAGGVQPRGPSRTYTEARP